MTRIRVSAALALALTSALLVAACGGGGDNNEDPQQVLTETFSNPTPIKSGNFDVDFKVEANGGDSPGTLEVKLGGQFQSQAANQFPQFDFDVSLRAESGSQTFSGSGGLTATGNRAFLNIQGTEYAVPQSVYDQFTSTYTQLQSQNGSSPQARSPVTSDHHVRWLEPSTSIRAIHCSSGLTKRYGTSSNRRWGGR